MLKALELSGFKSFADKTRFEFPPGITVVVGPNGSGKSNIVDAMKWVLGEQSAKSLRGREMADVIFKGSGSRGGRKPANTAEATICFDNPDGILAIDAPEVRVTRRVYRSGEGEYLINGNPCRLRDVKDLFRGTGVGTDAYSLIEQGKVDTLLQASVRERRAIFEEAAGISRFKAKKVETQRRLERVEQNLTRLADIVDEVDSRLRTVRNQASKARRYKEYTDRLQQLRTHVALVDWRQYSEKLQQAEAEVQLLRDREQQAQQELQAAETQLAAFDQDTEHLRHQVRESEAAYSDQRQKIAADESSLDHDRSRMSDLEHEIQRYRRQLVAMTTRAGDLGLQLEQAQQQLQLAQGDYQRVRSRVAELDDRLRELTASVETLRQQCESRRLEHTEQLKISGSLSTQISSLESELSTTRQTIERCRRQHDELSRQLAEAQQQREEYDQRQQQAQQRVDDAERQLSEARRALADRKRQFDQHQKELVELQRRHAVCSERANVLESLERRHEGLSAGVKEILARWRDHAYGPLAQVRGMVADLIRVDVALAPLVDVALGEATQHIVVEGDQLARSLAQSEMQLAGRVGLMPLQANAADREEEPSLPQLEADPAVIGRADRLVEAEALYQPLVTRLLARTWFVETLADALRLQGMLVRPVRFVTRAGERLDPDGTLLAGPRHAGIGLVSRRSQLRSLQREIAELETQIDESEAVVARLASAIAEGEQQHERWSNETDEATRALTECRLQASSVHQRCDDLLGQQESVAADLQAARNKCRAAEEGHAQQQQRLSELQARISMLEQGLQSDEQRLARLENELQGCAQQVTTAKVELAKSEQRVDDLQGQLVRYEEDQRERERALADVRQQLHAAQQRHQQAVAAALRHTAQLAEWYLASQQQAEQIRHLRAEQEQVSQQRTTLARQLAQVRRELHQLEENRHRQELHANQVQLERGALAERVRDEYGLELAEIQDEPHASEEEQRQRSEIDREIADLRRKVSNIGAVNMAALEEIEELEERHGGLVAQYQDLVEAKESLARIIQRINADSRRLFTETLEAIRANFQTLFRRVFGGGQADIVLEEGVDILEAGIDIVATPPGKHSLGISLLSGGERALTAVTLLLAIFQYRPSPFCVLDEVDGPLDEANIGRFVDVLKEFLQWTKFVVVTHSKKTMTAANTLYGVTMQESGVSKRVSVQFDDVSDDGHIRREALEREAEAQADSAEDERGAA